MKVSAILVDNERFALDTLALMLQKFCPEVEVIGQALNVEEALNQLTQASPDVLFLDIHMDNESGFDLLRKIQLENTKLVFVTAHENYAIEALKAGAWDYILKPIGPDELIQCVDKVLLAKTGARQAVQQPNSLLLATRKAYVKVDFDDIMYLEADSNYCTFFTTEKSYCTSKSLKHYEDRLPVGFCRVHNAFIVNLKYVQALKMGRDQPLILTTNQEIPVSRNYRKNLVDRLNQF